MHISRPLFFGGGSRPLLRPTESREAWDSILHLSEEQSRQITEIWGFYHNFTVLPHHKLKPLEENFIPCGQSPWHKKNFIVLLVKIIPSALKGGSSEIHLRSHFGIFNPLKTPFPPQEVMSYRRTHATHSWITVSGKSRCKWVHLLLVVRKRKLHHHLSWLQQLQIREQFSGPHVVICSSLWSKHIYSFSSF